MDLTQAQRQLLVQLKDLYEEREAASIADWVMERVTGLKKIDRILRKDQELGAAPLELLKKYSAELALHRPVQYVLQESWFCGLKLYVDENVLIPRPETEELVEWVVEEAESRKLQTASLELQATGQATGQAPFTILDVGTGSGCIAIALSKKLTGAGALPSAGALPATTGADHPVPAAPAIIACDISAEALAIARRNAATHQAAIDFRQIDFLDSRQWETLPATHTIISNPPYIPLSDKPALAPHVTGFEPHLALFVGDKDPLLFYRTLAAFAKKKLLPGGSIFVEIHAALSEPTMQVFREAGFPVITLKKDMQGQDRMIRASSQPV